jgi:hypothetical protein
LGGIRAINQKMRNTGHVAAFKALLEATPQFCLVTSGRKTHFVNCGRACAKNLEVHLGLAWLPDAEPLPEVAECTWDHVRFKVSCAASLSGTAWVWLFFVLGTRMTRFSQSTQFHSEQIGLYAERDIALDSAHVFVHARDARHAGNPVLDVKNAFHTALEEAGIEDFTWHDFRHDYASRLVMAGVSLRAVAELLGHKVLRMVMRYAHLSAGFLSDEVKKLDTFSLSARSRERATKATCLARRAGSGESDDISACSS